MFVAISCLTAFPIKRKLMRFSSPWTWMASAIDRHIRTMPLAVEGPVKFPPRLPSIQLFDQKQAVPATKLVQIVRKVDVDRWYAMEIYIFGCIKSYEIPYLAGLKWLNIHKSQQWHGVKGARWLVLHTLHCWRVRWHWTVHDKLQLWVLSIWLGLFKRHAVSLLQRKLQRPYYLHLFAFIFERPANFNMLISTDSCWGMFWLFKLKALLYAGKRF